jgi:antitoxin HigA-1
MIDMLTMKNPAPPGELVRDLLDEFGLSVAVAAEGLKITRQQLYNVISGRSAVTPEMAVRLEKAFGSTAETWLQMQVNYDLAQVRKRARQIAVKRFRARRAAARVA